MGKCIVANWKANIPSEHVEHWIRVFTTQYRSQEHVEVVLAVPFLYMAFIHARIKGMQGVCLAAQGVSPYPGGSYTGATPASWLKNIAAYGLIGHQERRRYFHETVQDIAAQVRECVAVGITPILCLGDNGPAEIRAALDDRELSKVLVAYTPEHAVALEKIRDLDAIQKGIHRIQGYFPDRPLLYGGGVDDENGPEVLALPEVSGIMLGRGCLDAEKFVRIIS